MANLGSKIAEDIRNRFNSGDFTKEVVAEAGDIHTKSIRQLSKAGKDASGTDFFPLDPVYANGKERDGGSGIADLYSASSGDHALDDMRDNPKGKEFSIEFGSAEQEDYMGAHYEGSRARGDFADMPVRRWFPQEKDKDEPAQRHNIEQIEEIIERFMNEDRTIKVTQRIR